MHTQWRMAAAKALTVVGSVVGITALAGVVLILPLKAQQDAEGVQRLGTPDAAERQRICASNMRQMTYGFFAHSTDYYERFPTGTQNAPGDTPTKSGRAATGAARTLPL